MVVLVSSEKPDDEPKWEDNPSNANGSKRAVMDRGLMDRSDRLEFTSSSGSGSIGPAGIDIARERMKSLGLEVLC